GTAYTRPVGDWAGSPAERAAPGSLPRITAASPGPALAPNGSVRQAGYTVPAPAEQAVPFDPAAVEVRYQGGRWVWTDGRRELRDFGGHRAEAQAALQMARELRA